MANTKKSAYSESSIRVLKGLEPVKQRPGMYTRTENPLHILQEVIDNAADEALGGYANQIAVTLHTDGSISVLDNGRGIPIGKHPDERVPVIEIVFTRLHAGGKFDKGREGAYAFSGGLHGVGVSVTNALCKRLDVTVWREGKCAQISFAHGEVTVPLQLQKLQQDLRKIVPARHADADSTKIVRQGGITQLGQFYVNPIQDINQTGTYIRIWPDAKYFDVPHIPINELQRQLRAKAVLLAGVQVSLQQEKTGEQQSWCYQHGLRDYLLEALAGHSELVVPLFEAEHFANPEQHPSEEMFAPGEGASWVIAWTEEGTPLRESYVNLIPTPAGGTHESGLREGLYQALKNFIEIHALLPKGVRLLAEDVFARVSFVLSAKVLDPQFQGQIKEKLNSRDALKLIAGFVRPALELWLNQNLVQGRKLAEMVIRQAQARTRAGQKIEKKKSSGVAVLPGKLTDCESTDIQRNELFLVEGDSAGGSAKMGRDKTFQAILPLRGKVLNTWETEADRLFANNEVHDIAVAIGVDPHREHDHPDLSNLRYGKICILSDADVDGAHIQVLLLTLFFKHFPKLIEQGHIYIAQPPLFRVDVPARGKRPIQKRYALDEDELAVIEDKLQKEGLRSGSWQISRFKGLGEMSAEQLWETTLNPDTRRLLPVSLGSFDQQSTQAVITMLMAKNEASARRAWLEKKGNETEADI